MLRTIEGGPPITDHDVACFEQEHGIALPDAYKSFLLSMNGGRPERDLFSVQGCQGNPVGRVHLFFALKDPIESCNLDWNLEMYAERIDSGLLPIATTEGADKICLCTTGEMLEQIFYWDAYELKLYVLADSFESFTNKLYADEHSPVMSVE